MPDDPELIEALRIAARQGAIGEASLAGAVAHSRRFLPGIPPGARRLVDLGSGGGLPGLVIAWHRRDVHVLLVDRRASRTDVLRRLVSRLGLATTVDVITADLAELSERAGWAHTADVVTARSFGSPSETIRIAAPLLIERGRLLVSAPPPGDVRWAEPPPGWTVNAASTPGVLVVERTCFT